MTTQGQGMLVKRLFSQFPERLFGVCLLLSVFLAGCATTDPANSGKVPELRPGILQGYLDNAELPNSFSLLPPAPESGSAIHASDVEINRQMRASVTRERLAYAARDANLHFPAAADTFSCALGIEINEQDTPRLYRLLRRSMTDAGLSTYAAKNHYQRKRPFMVNGQPTCTPEDQQHLSHDGSYPSGHTALGWAWALILTEVAPEKTDAVMARGWAFGESRMYCNVHWNSDVNAGRVMGAAAVARLHADEEFRAELDAARQEYKAALVQGLVPQADCDAEAAALLGH